MRTLKDLSMALRSVGILYLFYLHLMNSINVPLSVIVLISLGSISSALWCNDAGKNKNMIGKKFFNYAIGLVGITLIVKQYM